MVHVLLHTYMDTQPHTYTHTHTYTIPQTCTHTHMHVQPHICRHTHMHMQPYTHTCNHTHMQPHTRTCTCNHTHLSSIAMPYTLPSHMAPSYSTLTSVFTLNGKSPLITLRVRCFFALPASCECMDKVDIQEHSGCTHVHAQSC